MIDRRFRTRLRTGATVSMDLAVRQKMKSHTTRFCVVPFVDFRVYAVVGVFGSIRLVRTFLSSGTLSRKQSGSDAQVFAPAGYTARSM